MKLTKFLLTFAFGLLGVFSAYSQNITFSDEAVAYTFELPEAVWKQTVKPSLTSPNVEYVYGERASGHLDVRQIPVKAGETLSDIIRNEERRLQFQPGFVAGKEEDFKGALSGRVFNYEFVRSGRNMSGRFYFLKADNTIVYVLRFTGREDKLRSVRNQTDSIARTFNLKKTK